VPEISELAIYTFRLPNRFARGFESGIPRMSATVPIILNNCTLSSLTDIVFEIIGNGKVLHGKHDKRNDAYKKQDYPGTVSEKVFEIFFKVLLLCRGGLPFRGWF
jgi:hypothetical protein